MRVLQLKKMYLPAISILAVVLLLLILIGISTFRNIDREEQTTLKFVHQQGLTIIRALEAGARAGMMMPMWGEDSIGSLIQETGKSKDIAYIYLIDANGKVVHHSNPSLEGMSSAWQPLARDSGFRCCHEATRFPHRIFSSSTHSWQRFCGLGCRSHNR